RWTVEGSENAIASRLDLMAMKPREVAAYRGVMLVEKVVPAMIAQRRSLLRRADYVGKEHRRQHPVGFGSGPRTGQEFLDRIGDLRGVFADEGYVVGPWQFEIAGARNVLCEIAPTLHVDGHIFSSVDDQGRHSDRGYDPADIDLAVHAHQGGRGGGT